MKQVTLAPAARWNLEGRPGEPMILEPEVRHADGNRSRANGSPGGVKSIPTNADDDA